MLKTIIIDDNPLERLILKKIFSQNNLFPDAEYVADGAEVMDRLQHNTNKEALPDVIFLDIHMPYSGWDFLKDLENIFTRLLKKPSVYIVSSSVNSSDMSRAASYPFVKGYINKPMEREQLKSLYNSHAGC